MDAKTDKKSKKPRKSRDDKPDRGPKISEDTINYFKRVEETIKEGFQSNDDKEIFVDNVFEEVEKEAVDVCQCHITSHIIEDLVTIATVSNLRMLMKIFSKDWSSVYKNKCSSHVLQSVLMSLPGRMSASFTNFVPPVEDSEDTAADVVITQLVLELKKVLMDDIDESICHVYASHVLRALLQVVGGTHVSHTVLKSRAARAKDKEFDSKPKEYKFIDFNIPDVFRKQLKKICKKVYKMENLNLCLINMNANPVIQTLLIVLNRVDQELCQKFIHKVISSSRIKEVESAPDNTGTVRLPPVAVDSVGSFLVEQIVSLATPDIYEELWSKLFKEKLIHFAIHPTANFVLQKLLQSCPNKQLFEELYSELSENIEDVLAVNHFGVITALADSCVRLHTKQDKLLKKVMEAFHCLEPESRQVQLVKLLASFNTYDVFFGEEEEAMESKVLSQINYHGSLLLQTMLKFKHTDVISNSLIALPAPDLRALSCNTCGSHVIDAFFQSTTVNEKQKDKMLKKFSGLLVNLACDKNGSRVLENVWRSLNIKQKTAIAEELVKHEDRVHSDRFGRHVYNRLTLRLFTSRRNDWLGVQGQEKKKRELFKDFTRADEGQMPKKKWKQRQN